MNKIPIIDVPYVQYGMGNNNLKYLWCYDFLNDELEGFTPDVARRHLELKFTLDGTDFKRVARGIVISYQGRNYLLIYTPGYTLYNEDIILKIMNRLSELYFIDYVINESGQNLLELQNI